LLEDSIFDDEFHSTVVRSVMLRDSTLLGIQKVMHCTVLHCTRSSKYVWGLHARWIWLTM